MYIIISPRRPAGPAAPWTRPRGGPARPAAAPGPSAIWI